MFIRACILSISIFVLTISSGVALYAAQERELSQTGTEKKNTIATEKGKSPEKPGERNQEKSGEKTTTPIEKTSQSGTVDTQKELRQEKKQEEAKLKKDINTYIIDSYKVQGTKIIKDLNATLLKSIPNPAERVLAYEKIRSALDLRLKKVDDLDMSEQKREILKQFLSHLISLLDKKIEELQ